MFSFKRLSEKANSRGNSSAAATPASATGAAAASPAPISATGAAAARPSAIGAAAAKLSAIGAAAVAVSAMGAAAAPRPSVTGAVVAAVFAPIGIWKPSAVFAAAVCEIGVAFADGMLAVGAVPAPPRPSGRTGGIGVPAGAAGYLVASSPAGVAPLSMSAALS